MKKLFFLLSFLLLCFCSCDFGVGFDFHSDDKSPDNRCVYNGLYSTLYYGHGDKHPDTCKVCDYGEWVTISGCCIDNVFYYSSGTVLGVYYFSNSNEVNPDKECEYCFVPANQDSIVQVSYWTPREAGVNCSSGQCDGKGNCVQ